MFHQNVTANNANLADGRFRSDDRDINPCLEALVLCYPCSFFDPDSTCRAGKATRDRQMLAASIIA